MTKATHTPGPWLSDGTTLYALNDDRVNRLQASFGAGFLTYTKAGRDERTSAEEIMANLALAKAAPDLLEALEGMLHHINGWDEAQLRKRWGEQVVSEIMSARAAIAKAKGEA